MRNPLSLEGLIGWLQKQPGDTAYDYTDPQDCLMHRYLSACGFDVCSIVVNIWADANGTKHKFPADMMDASHCDISEADFEWTYAAALRRAKAIQIASAGEEG